jgi:hypothetical protein
LPLVTASFSLGHIGKGNGVCAMLVEHGCGIIAVESVQLNKGTKTVIGSYFRRLLV